MKGRRILVSVLALGLLLALAVGLSLAQGPGQDEQARPGGAESLAQEVGGYIPIQGQLTDADGQPLDGDFNITFSLYNDLATAAEICSYTEVVSVTNGLFMAYIGGVCALPGVFTGDQLYLGIQVESDEEMAPRQPIYPVPYALSLKPGAKIEGSVSGNVLWVENTRATGTTYGVRGYVASPDGYGGHFDGKGIGLYARGGIDSPDLVLGGNDGRIYSDPADGNSNVVLVSNNRVQIHLDDNMDDGGGTFSIYNGEDAGIVVAQYNGDLYLAGDVRQDKAADGLVKAAVYAECRDLGSSITRSFNNVSGAITIANGAGVGRCTLDFGFVVTDRYFVATAFTSGVGAAARGVSCDWGADNEKLDCFRWNAAGDGANGEIMVLIY
jgi:hypothetical protein